MLTIYDSRLKREVKKATLKILMVQNDHSFFFFCFMSKPNDLIDLRFEMADDLT